MAVVEYLTGVDENDLRGFPWSNQVGLQFLLVKLGPNSIAADSIYTGFCPPDYDQPSQNLPCIGTNDGAQGYATARSRHPGGVNAAYCDGSVHFVQDGVDIAIWRSLGWIDDGNAPKGDF
jgi:prepilin-type processing-associated H-X9-DG protein